MVGSNLRLLETSEKMLPSDEKDSACVKRIGGVSMVAECPVWDVSDLLIILACTPLGCILSSHLVEDEGAVVSSVNFYCRMTEVAVAAIMNMTQGVSK